MIRTKRSSGLLFLLPTVVINFSAPRLRVEFAWLNFMVSYER
jgi:hypothetical protein